MISPATANAIQADWMALQSDAPAPKKARVFAAMKTLPQSFLAVNPSGLAQVMTQGTPAHAFPEPIAAAIQRAKTMRVQTALAWSTDGKWIALTA